MKLTQSLVAQFCHEANRAYCQSIGDSSQMPWEEAPQILKDSAVAGVDFHLHNDATPKESHESWLAHKEAEGWIWGSEKDIEKRIHPCMVPYDDLPEDQKMKDLIFSRIVSVLVDVIE